MKVAWFVLAIVGMMAFAWFFRMQNIDGTIMRNRWTGTVYFLNGSPVWEPTKEPIIVHFLLSNGKKAEVPENELDEFYKAVIEDELTAKELFRK